MNRRLLRLFLNVAILNVSEIVSNAVKKKVAPAKQEVEGSWRPGRYLWKAGQAMGSGMASAAAATAATAVGCSTSKQTEIGKKIGASIAEKVPMQLAENGIEAEARLRYVKAAFAIVEIDILHADLEKVLGQKIAAEKVQQGMGFMAALEELLGSHLISEKLDAMLVNKIAEGLETKLPVTMKEKLHENGVEIDVKCMKEADELDLLFGHVLDAEV